MARPGRPSEDMPPMSDPRWAEWSAPLLKYLTAAPRTWTELESWRRARGVSAYLFRNCLAWLEDAGVARSEGNGKRVKWTARKLEEETDDGNQIQQRDGAL